MIKTLGLVIGIHYLASAVLGLVLLVGFIIPGSVASMLLVASVAIWFYRQRKAKTV